MVAVNFSYSVYDAKEKLAQPVLVVDNPTSGAVIQVVVFEDYSTNGNNISSLSERRVVYCNLGVYHMMKLINFKFAIGLDLLNPFMRWSI